jgi:hypothetical protein
MSVTDQREVRRLRVAGLAHSWAWRFVWAANGNRPFGVSLYRTASHILLILMLQFMPPIRAAAV